MVVRFILLSKNICFEKSSAKQLYEIGPQVSDWVDNQQDLLINFYKVHVSYKPVNQGAWQQILK